MKNITNKYREFGILLGIFFPFFIGYLIPLIGGHGFKLWTLYVGFILLFFSIFAPNKLSSLYKRWMQLGDILAIFNSNIILGFVFFLLLLPISFLMKIFNYDPLRLKNIKDIKTYRIKRDNDRMDFEKMF